MADYEKAVALWQGRNVTNDAELAEALNGHSIAFAYHSGRIENENITYHDTRCCQLGERPGEYKRHDYVTGREEVGAPPEDVGEEMSELLSELTGIPDGKTLVAAAYFHAKFENIHPFADGNGRTGRLAMNYFLVLHNHPPITVHEEDRKSYYDALEAWDLRQDLEPLCVFLHGQTAKTWKKQTLRAERKANGNASILSRLRDYGVESGHTGKIPAKDKRPGR